MNEKELMVGDWFRFRYTIDGKEIVKTFRISQIENGLGKYYVWGDGFGRMCVPERLEPIPLTAEILEKNGFKYNPDAYAFPVPAKCYDFPLGQGFFIEQFADGSYRITDHCFVCFRYVHEFQHVLRLCGIDKEIVI